MLLPPATMVLARRCKTWHMLSVILKCGQYHGHLSVSLQLDWLHY
ncbi:hypothetical protein Zm00014a_027643 [Zea mays]|uniref:Uncharacterized protein n=1 Tax=Zea mays TaxID=4577 RepID=A0A3L6EJV7_MAIZE|nr:hypothetical protein Zm00014a_027643 [Zea mays]